MGSSTANTTVPFLSDLNFITDIVVDFTSKAPDQPITTAMQMNVEVLSDAAHDGKYLLFKKISSSEWEYDQIVELWVSRLFQLYVIFMMNDYRL